MGPSLSLCMIVKNESKVLERCLKSVTGHVDEIIIADTGSTDNTKEIANRFNVKLYDYKWTNNFSAARNFVAKKASGDWILVLDADEYVSEENLKEAKNELLETKHSVLAVNILNFTGEFGGGTAQHRHVRLYRNNGEIEFHRAIHEQLRNKNASKLSVGLSPLVLYHTGYLNKTVKEKQKSNRNKQLLNIELKKNKAFDYFNLGNELKIERKTEEALNAYIKAYKLKEDHTLDWLPFCLCNMTECLIELKRYDNALSVIRDAILIYEKTADFHYLKGQIYLFQGRNEDAKKVFESIVDNSDLFTAQVKSLDYRSYYPNLRLGYILAHEDNSKEAIKYYTNAINYNKYSVEAITEVVRLLTKEHTVEEVFTFLEEKVFKKTYSKSVLQQLMVRLVENGQTAVAQKICMENLSDEKYFLQLFRFKLDCILNENKEIEMDALLFGVRNHIIDAADLLIYLWNNKERERAFLKELHLIVKRSNLAGIQALMFSSLEQEIKNVEIKNIDDDILLSLLDRSLNYKNTSIVNYIIGFIQKAPGNFSKELLSRIGNLLYVNGYKNQAIKMYQVAKESERLDVEAINHIVDHFIDHDNYKDALLFVFYGIEHSIFDFFTLKIGINILRALNEEEDLEKLILLAMDIYPDSNWLRNVYLEV
jgi:glycosyltransferase involved in cell wall biosynthesis